jgi:hypothetical protein
MKITWTIMMVLIGFLTYSQVPVNGLISYYPFNGNANDSTANAIHGIVHNAQLTTDRYGNANSAYLFSDTSNYIQIPDNNLLHLTTEISISFWLYQTGTSSFGYNRLIDKVTAHTADGWILDTYSTGQNLRFMVGSDGSTSSSYTLNQWHHIAVTYKSGIVKFYLDGAFWKQVINTVTKLPVNNLPIIIGNTRPNDPDKLNLLGKMDNIGFWNRALSQQEISNIYQGCTMPDVKIIASDTTTFCNGDSVVLTANLQSSTYIYTWQKNGATINGAKSRSYTVKTSGSYTVIVDSAKCSVISSAVVVTVNPVPTVNCQITPYINIQTDSVALTGNPSGGVYSGAGVSGSYFNPSKAGLGIKTVKYTYTNIYGCSKSSTASSLVYDTIKCFVVDSIKVTDTLVIIAKLSGVNPPDNYNTIKAYPNPANDYITIDYGNYSSMNGYTLKILNSAGKTVFTTTINQQSSSINLSTWSGKGVYFVHLIDKQSKTIEVRKIILQ